MERHRKKTFKYQNDKKIIQLTARSKRLSLVGLYSDFPEDLDDWEFLLEYPHYDAQNQ